MFEVNFFEKKQKNYLPHLLGAITFVILTGIGLYFVTWHASLVSKDEENKAWLVSQAEQVLVARQIRNYEQTTAQLNEEKSLFEDMQYPMATAAGLLVKRVPGGSGNIKSFNLSAENQLVLILENLSVLEIDETVLDFRNQDYVANVELIRVETGPQSANQLAEIWVTLDEVSLRGAATE